MRISTNMIYEKGVAQLQLQTAALLRTQQQLATGRRILAPSDDPIASARALEVGQSKAINKQFATNQGNATDQLGLLENRLVGIGDILQYARERAVQAGNASLGETELGFIASDMRSQFEALLGHANSQDGQGDYLFSGFKSQDQPFAGGLGNVAYAGDQGSRTIQVSSSRYMPVSVAGSEVFDRTRSLTDSVRAANGAHNTGSATLTLAAGSDQPTPGIRYAITFDGGTATVTRRAPGLPDTEVTEDLVYDDDPTPTLSFTDGEENIVFDVAGTPADGDAFEVFVASTDLFENFALFIDALERPGAASVADGATAFALDNLDAALDNVLRVRAQVGSQMVELENLANVGGDLDLQYAETLSRLQDVDPTEAISRLTQQQTYLQAAQQSFMRVTGLSLFNFLN